MATLLEVGRIPTTTQQTSSSLDNDKIFPFNNLPDEILLYIFSFNSVRDVCVFGQVCKHWCTLSQDNSLWKELVGRFFPCLSFKGEKIQNYRSVVIAEKKLITGFEQDHFAKKPLCLVSKDQDSVRDNFFKHITDCRKIDRNYVIGKRTSIISAVCSPQFQLNGSCDVTNVQYVIGESQIYITNFDEDTIDVLDSTLKKQGSVPLNGEKDVHSLHQEGKYLAMGTKVGVEVWDLASKQSVRILKLYKKYISRVVVKENKVYSIDSKQHEIYISDLSKGSTIPFELQTREERTIRGIHSLVVAEGKLVVSYDIKEDPMFTIIKVFDGTTYACLHTFSSKGGGRLSVEGNVLIAATNSWFEKEQLSSAHVFNLKTGKSYTYVIEGFLDAKNGKVYVLERYDRNICHLVERDYYPLECRLPSPEPREV